MSSPIFRTDQLFTLFFYGVIILIHGGLSLISVQESGDLLETIRLVEMSPQPIIYSWQDELEDEQNQLESDKFSKDPFKQVTAESYLVVDLNSSAILKSRNIDLPLYPASTIKLMTALVARKLYPLDQLMLTNPGINAIGNKVNFSWGTQVSVEQLLAVILINSGNDAATILASNYSDGYQQFINQMNAEAQSLSLKNTTFFNPTGIDDYRQLTTSWDLFLLAKEVLKDPLLESLVNTKNKTIQEVPIGREHPLTNTNQLLFQYEQARGIKTGTTQLAQQVLIALWEEKEHPILIVVMGSQDRYQDTLVIINWIQENVDWLK